MDIKLVKDNGSVLVKNRDLIKKFVSNLYQSKRLGEDKMNEDELKSFLANVGAQEINTQVAEEGWWIGKYGEEQELYKESNIA